MIPSYQVHYHYANYCAATVSTVTAGNFFGPAEGSLYSLILSNSGGINGTEAEPDVSLNNNADTGLICEGEQRVRVRVSSDPNFKGNCLS